jgi:hypothetical protein
MKPQAYPQASPVAGISHFFPALFAKPTLKPQRTGPKSMILRRLVALGMAALLLPLAQVEVLAQQAPGWPQANPYPPGQPYSGQYSQSPYPQNQPYNNQYAPSEPQGYARPAYGQQPSYGQQPPAADQPNADAGPGGYARGYQQPQPAAQPFTAEQLEEMLAPIALYPDGLLAQVLAAATYPDQVSVADQWLRAQGYASADQIAGAAQAQNWDPSVKALTAFPQVLAEMNQNLAWTTDVGNAYYNQPQDVMQTVQVLRQRAQAAGTLENSPQETVSYDQGNIELAPPNPQVVYVPAYNPWDAYGQPISPYPGFSLLGALQSFAGSGVLQFGMGIAMTAFMHTGFGWLSWALDWLGSSILFNHSSYSSRSTSVARWGGGYGHGGFGRGGYGSQAWGSNGGSGYGRSGYAGSGQGYNRSQMERERTGQSRDAYGRQGSYSSNGYNRGYGYTGGYQQNREYTRPQQGYGSTRPTMGSEYAAGSNRGYSARPENAVRPAFQDYAYSRAQQRTQPQMPARQQQAYARPGYGSSFYGGTGQTYGYGRQQGSNYGAPQQSWRAPTMPSQRGGFEQRSYAASSSRGFMQSAPKQERSGGFHMFGGGRSSEHSFGGGKAPKSYGGGGHGGGGGHSSSHSGGGHHH